MRIGLLGLLCLAGVAVWARRGQGSAARGIHQKVCSYGSGVCEGSRNDDLPAESVKIQELTPSGSPEGKYEIISDIIFAGDGKRTEKGSSRPHVDAVETLLR